MATGGGTAAAPAEADADLQALTVAYDNRSAASSRLMCDAPPAGVFPVPCALQELILTQSASGSAKPVKDRVLYSKARTITEGTYRRAKGGKTLGSGHDAVFEMLAGPKQEAVKTWLAVDLVSAAGPCGALGHHRFELQSASQATDLSRKTPSFVSTKLAVFCVARWFDTPGNTVSDHIARNTLSDLVAPFWFPASETKSFALVAQACGNLAAPRGSRTGIARISTLVTVYPRDTYSLTIVFPALASASKSKSVDKRGDGETTWSRTTKLGDETSSTSKALTGKDGGNFEVSIERSEKTGNSTSTVKTVLDTSAGPSKVANRIYEKNSGFGLGPGKSVTYEAGETPKLAVVESKIKLELLRNGETPADFSPSRVIEAYQRSRELLQEIKSLFGKPPFAYGWSVSGSVSGLSGEIKAEWGYREVDNLVGGYVELSGKIILIAAELNIFLGLRWTSPTALKVWGMRDAEIGGTLTIGGEIGLAASYSYDELEDTGTKSSHKGSVTLAGKITVVGMLKTDIGGSRWIEASAKISGGVTAKGDVPISRSKPLSIEASAKSERVVFEAMFGMAGTIHATEPCLLAEERPLWKL